MTLINLVRLYPVTHKLFKPKGETWQWSALTFSDDSTRLSLTHIPRRGMYIMSQYATNLWKTL